MKRASGLIELSRRDFCAFACLGIAAAGCLDSGTGAVQTGGLDGIGNGPSPDAGSGVHPGDGGVTNPDGGVAASCTGTFTDVGAATAYTLNVPKYLSSIAMFVVKDASGFYALTSRCTHQGVTLQVSGGTKFHCNAHGADFTLNGAVIDGPTSKALQHYAMCTLANGNLGVETTLKVAATDRLVA